MKVNAFVRNTNSITETGHHMIKLPQSIWKKMGWEINEHVTITAVVGKDVQEYIMIEKEK